MTAMRVRMILLAGFLTGIVLWISHVKRGLAEAPANAAWQTYRRVDWWILSAQCTQHRKVLLVACGPQNQLIPIEDVSPTDDRGHGLIANGVALFQKRPFEKVDMVRINVWINAVSVAVLSLVLFLCGMPWAALLCMGVGAVYGIPGPMASADAQATFFGEYCLALTPIPWIVQMNRPGVTRKRFVLAGALSWAALTAAILLREANGLVGFVCSCLLLLLMFCESRQVLKKSIVLYAFVAAMLVLSLNANTLMLSWRTRWLSLPPAHLIASHGIAHAFHQGLGTEENPWGINYDDENGAETVVKLNPQAYYGTPDYYREIARLYRNILFHHPLKVGDIYWKKFKKTLGLPLRFGGISIFWYVLAVILALPFMGSRSGWSALPLRTVSGLIMALAIFLLQGVLIQPSAMFLYPAKFGMLMLIITLVEAGMSRYTDSDSDSEAKPQRRRIK